MDAVIIDKSRGCLVIFDYDSDMYVLPKADDIATMPEVKLMPFEDGMEVKLKPIGGVVYGYFKFDEPIENAAFVPNYAEKPVALYVAGDVPDSNAYTKEVAPEAAEALQFAKHLLPDRVATWYACLRRRSPDIPENSDYVWAILRKLAQTCTGHFEQSVFFKQSVRAARLWKHEGTYDADNAAQYKMVKKELRDVALNAAIDLKLEAPLITYRVGSYNGIVTRPKRDVLAVALAKDCYGGDTPPVKHIIQAGVTVFPMFIFEDDENLPECEVVVIDAMLTIGKISYVYVDHT